MKLIQQLLQLTEAKNAPSVDELIKMFRKINSDVKKAAKSPDDAQPVELTDSEFYADQIYNSYRDDGLTKPTASKLAKEMATKAKAENIPMCESAEHVVELSTFTGKTIPHEAWTEGVMYKGHNVFKLVYTDEPEALGKAEDGMKEDCEDNDDRLDFQESYLGYSPSKDIFIQGYDGWLTEDHGGDDEEDTNCSPYIEFTVNDAGKITVKNSGHDYGNNRQMWYGTSGGLKVAHAKYPDLLDIRLD